MSVRHGSLASSVRKLGDHEVRAAQLEGRADTREDREARHEVRVADGGVALAVGDAREHAPRPGDTALHQDREALSRRNEREADGPTDPSVTLDVSFEKKAGGRTYVVEVRARDDLGNVQDWKRAGTVTVTRRHGHHHDDD